MSAATLLRGYRDLVREHWLALALLTVWALAPLVVLLIYAAQHSAAIIGAYGYDPFDQLAYLAWIRDEGSHLLASDLWHVGPSAHDYLQPMYLISGLLWRVGASLQVAYLIWVPVGIVVLFGGFAAYVNRLLADRWQRITALLLALFYLTPVLQLARWTGLVSPTHRFQLATALYDSDSALNLWGFDHAAITIGLMPVFLLSSERVLRDGARRSRGPVAMAALSGAIVSWLQPWQGVTLLLIVCGLVLVRGPRRRYLSLLVPVGVTILPLIYTEVLTHADPIWRAFETRTRHSGGIGPWWALVAGFAPLLLVAAFGVRRPADDRHWMLVLWVPATAVVYFALPQFPPHALKGVTLPLAILAVTGWGRLRDRLAPRLRPGSVALVVAAVVAVALFTVPAAIYQLTDAVSFTGTSAVDRIERQLQLQTSDQAAALHYLSALRTSGAVLAPYYLTMSVPGFTGRQAYAGHQMWQPAINEVRTNAFYAAVGTSAAERRALLRASGARFVIVDCSAPAAVSVAIAPIVRSVARFGCLTVDRYEPERR